MNEILLVRRGTAGVVFKSIQRADDTHRRLAEGVYVREGQKDTLFIKAGELALVPECERRPGSTYERVPSLYTPVFTGLEDQDTIAVFLNPKTYQWCIKPVQGCEGFRYRPTTKIRDWESHPQLSAKKNSCDNGPSVFRPLGKRNRS